MKKILRLKEIISERGLVGQDVAKALEITTTTLSNFNQGNTFPNGEMLLKIADYLDIDIRELFYPTKSDDSLQELFVKDADGNFKSIGYLKK